MKKVDKLIKHITSQVSSKSILEAACGCGELSLAASNFAKDVCCIDIDASR